MPFRKYIYHSSTPNPTPVSEINPSNFIKNIDINFSAHFGLKRLGIHHIILPAGCRTSYPHAESDEEEFVYVISGNPDAWIDGNIYRLRPGLAVGFPAGTGLVHTFINNTPVDVELLVLGERTKEHNKFIYPLNLDLQQGVGAGWWTEWPRRAMGGHPGLPGILTDQKAAEDLANIMDAPGADRTGMFSYPGDLRQETFGDGVRLTDKLALKALGIWHEKLRPGKRSSWPHAHKLEEEFVFILVGQPKIWMNGYLYSVQPGDAVYFPPGTNIAHTIINDSEETVEYLAVGEADGAGNDERIVYPLHQERNEYCRIKGQLWINPPGDLPMGSHTGQSQRGAQ